MIDATHNQTVSQPWCFEWDLDPRVPVQPVSEGFPSGGANCNSILSCLSALAELTLERSASSPTVRTGNSAISSKEC